MIHFIYRFLASLLLLGISVLAQAQDNWGNTEYRGKPWVKNISIPYSIEKGLQNKHLTVSSSHGIYWKNDKQPLTIVFIALALLFQPFMKIALGRAMWNIVDVIVALGMITLWWLERNKRGID